VTVPVAGPWSAVVPVKSWQSAKSRLAVPLGLRAEVAQALTLDTLDVLTTHPDVAHVVVVTADAEAGREARLRGATVLDEALAGSISPLNGAVLQGCEFVAAALGDGPTVIVPADLAYLSAGVMAAALGALGSAGAAHIPDLAGTGTTLLAAPRASAIDPHYGIGSSALHAHHGFRRLLDVDPRIRTDIDQMADLVSDPSWSLGPRLSAVLERIALGA
jgi:2-phospho-L-lactate guanylyltransferase